MRTTKYKQTEIGVIPEDWEVKELYEILLSNPDYGINAAAVNYDDTLPTYLRITDIDDNGRFIKDNLSSVNDKNAINYYLKEDEIVFARTGASVGKTYLYKKIDGELVFAGFLIRTRINTSKANSKFIFYNTQTKNYQNWIIANSMRSGQPGINSNEIKSLQIPLPPLPEQEAIATALSDADAWIESLEQLIAKKRLIKQGAMQELLTPPSTSSGNADGEALEPWEVKKLGEVCEIIMGQSPLSENYNQNGIGLPLVQGNADINNRKTIIRNYTSQITKRGKIGDIIMSVRAPVGEIAKSTFECCLGRGVCAIRAKNDYLYHYLIYSENNWGQFSTGSTFDSVNSNQVNDFAIAIPKRLSEQERIATILSDMDAELEALEQQLDKARQIKQGMMQELLTGRVRLV